MAMTRPSKDNFEFWLPMQESSGTRYDVTGHGCHALDSDLGGFEAPPSNTGHVQSAAADFERSNTQGLYIPDNAAHHGDRDWCMGGWFYQESDNWILMSKGGDGLTSNWCCFIDSSQYASFGIGVNGDTGWNNDYRARDTTVLSLATWYFYFAFWDMSAERGYIKIYDTSGSLVASDDTTLMDMGANNGPSIYFGTTADASKPLDCPVTGNVDFADGRLEQWWLYDGSLTADNISWLVNGGKGRIWDDFFDTAGMPIWYSRMRKLDDLQRKWQKRLGLYDDLLDQGAVII